MYYILGYFCPFFALFTLIVIWNHVAIENSKLYFCSLNETLSRQIWNGGKTFWCNCAKKLGSRITLYRVQQPPKSREFLPFPPPPPPPPLCIVHTEHLQCTCNSELLFRIYITNSSSSLINYWGISMFWFPGGNLFTLNFQKCWAKMYLKPGSNTTLYTPTGVIS